MAHEIIATRIDVLKWIKALEVVEAGDLVSAFGYALRGARKKLYRLEKANLVEKTGHRQGAYCLTNEGHRRLDYYEHARGS